MVKRFSLFALVLVLTFSVCFTPLVAAEEGRNQERLEVSAYWRDTLNPPQGRMKEYIEDKFNIEFNIIEVPISEYSNRRNMALASGDLPDIFQTEGPDDLSYYQMLDEGGIIKMLDDYLADAPNLAKWLENDTAKLYTLTDKTGHYYGIPRGYCYFSAAVYYRKDLLDKYGLEVPVTLDEYINAMEIICKGEGIYGITSVWNLWGVTNILGSYNGLGTSGYMLKDGKYSDVAIWDETREGLKVLAQMYEKGILHPEFMIINDFDQYIEKFVTGDVASIFAHVEANYYYDRIISQTEQQIEGAEVVAALPQEGPLGVHTHAFLPYSTTMHISEKTDEEKTKRIIQLFDFLFSEEGYEFNQYGIEGVHYTKDDEGNYITNMEEILKDTSDPAMDALSKWRWYSDIMPGAIPDQSIDVDIQKGIYNQIQQLCAGHYSPVVGYSSDNKTIIEPELTSLRDEYFVKFITGEKNLDTDWDEFVDLYYDTGYDILEQEVNDFMNN